MTSQLVVSGGQDFPGRSVLLNTNIPLEMFHPNADGKFFPFHGDACITEHGKGVSGGVPWSQN